jgi:hypothetical protein
MSLQHGFTVADHNSNIASMSARTRTYLKRFADDDNLRLPQVS